MWLVYRKYHEPLPVVPLKILAHNELVGRVIGKTCVLNTSNKVVMPLSFCPSLVT